MSLLVTFILVTAYLAYANGANDNFKGVATHFGSKAVSYGTAITIATVAQMAGSISSLFLAQTLIVAFSGKGLVPDAIAASPAFSASVGVAAASTVLLATLTGFPISTTHALIGAMIGGGVIAVGMQLNVFMLGSAFVAPLIVSPILAICLTAPFCAALQRFESRFGVLKETCVCIRPGQFIPVSQFQGDGGVAPALSLLSLGVVVDSQTNCVDKYSGAVLGVSLQRLVDSVHFVSASAVCYARGLNDTPKIVGLLLVVKALDIRYGLLAITAAMAMGGLLNARKVAQTISRRLSQMDDGMALTANVMTALLVIVASRLGLPVSTTHVSIGAITAIGLVNGTANRVMISTVVMSWVLTLPIAGIFGACCYLMIQSFG